MSSRTGWRAYGAVGKCARILTVPGSESTASPRPPSSGRWRNLHGVVMLVTCSDIVSMPTKRCIARESSAASSQASSERSSYSESSTCAAFARSPLACGRACRTGVEALSARPTRPGDGLVHRLEEVGAASARSYTMRSRLLRSGLVERSLSELLVFPSAFGRQPS